VAAWADERVAPLHAHVSEQPTENRDCLAAHGLTPTALLARAGALSERFTAVHATHLTDADIGDLGGHRCSVCCCPTTERDLADGVGPAGRLVDAGARLTLGSDSHAVIDLFEEARGVELHERLQTGVRGHHRAADLLRAATADGHASIGWPEVGTLSVGAAADLVTVDLRSVRLAGTEPSHVLEAVVFAGAAADVHHVVVGGEVVVADGRHVRIDVPRELDRSVSALAAVRTS
jgi:formiminoglutamate deiminase